MRKLLLLIILFIFITGVLNAQVTCNTFQVKEKLNGDEITVWLDTDCPDFTEVTLTVSRLYWEEGSEDAYSISYDQKQSTVGVLKEKQTVSLNSKEWKSDLEQKQKEMAEVGLGFDVAKISDKIEIRAVVPLNQSNPKFGEYNSKLKGQAVPNGSKIIEDELAFEYPIDGGAKKSKYVGATSLEVNGSYSVSGKTPLMPRFNFNGDVSTLEYLKYLQGDEVIKVVDKKSKGGSPWYQVKVYNSSGKEIAKGWINSIALTGQNIMTKWE